MTLISIKKTAVVEPAPTGTVSLYVDSADSHLKQVDEAGAIIDLTDGSATSSPNMANEVNITLTALRALTNYPLKTTYRITDASQGVVRVYVKSATELTATAMLEGTDSGTGSITNGQWGNYDLDGDVFTPTATSGTWTPTISGETGISPVVIHGGWYTKVDNVVNATCCFSIDFDVTEQEQGFAFTLPFEPNNDFSSGYELMGIAYNNSSIKDTTKIEVLANNGTKDGFFIVTLETLGSTCNCVINITYSIDN